LLLSHYVIWDYTSVNPKNRFLAGRPSRLKSATIVSDSDSKVPSATLISDCGNKYRSFLSLREPAIALIKPQTTE